MMCCYLSVHFHDQRVKDVHGIFHCSQQHSFQFQSSEHIRPKNSKTYRNLKRLVMSSNRQLVDCKGNRLGTSTATKFQSLVLVCIVEWGVETQFRMGDPASFVYVGFHHHR